jgi:hypothetical protein
VSHMSCVFQSGRSGRLGGSGSFGAVRATRAVRVLTAVSGASQGGTEGASGFGAQGSGTQGGKPGRIFGLCAPVPLGGQATRHFVRVIVCRANPCGLTQVCRWPLNVMLRQP